MVYPKPGDLLNREFSLDFSRLGRKSVISAGEMTAFSHAQRRDQLFWPSVGESKQGKQTADLFAAATKNAAFG